MVEASDFEIYQTATGYVAVTNESRRKILAALAKKERDLNDLVKITGKAKPTLSNLHVRELLAQGLVEELPHPTDARRKVYRLKGHRIGSSSVPLDKLRGAVKQYVSTSPLAHAFPLRQVLDVLLAAGARGQEAVLLQATKLGEMVAFMFPTTGPRDLLPQVASYWEREGIARTATIDLEHLSLEVDVDPRYAGKKEAMRLASSLLGGFLAGASGRPTETEMAGAETAGRVVVRLLT